MIVESLTNMQPKNVDDLGKIDSKSNPENQMRDPLLSSFTKNRGNVEHDVKIIIRKQPPAFMFPDQDFEIDYAFIRSEGSGEHQTEEYEKYVKDLQDLKVDAALFQVEHKAGSRTLPKYEPAETAKLTVLEHRRSASHISGTLMCRIECLADILRQSNSFAVKVFSNGELATIMIRPATTRTISLAPYKIMVSTTDLWENVWFKDEGGREKCIEILACAKDANDQILFQNIPLHLTLCYASTKSLEPSPVNNQDLLQILGRATNKNHRQIDQETGKAKIRFRIEDVSKNHQGQNFVLRVAANDSWNINPGFSPPITIRSKRTKRKSSLTGDREHGQSSVARSGSPTWRTTPFGEPESSPKRSPISSEIFDPNRLLQAYSGVAQWIDEVVTGLYPLQWHVLGYAQHPDGSPDYSRPYHNMPSPNAFISRILGAYNSSTKRQFQILGEVIEHHTSKARSPATPPSQEDALGYAGYGLGGRPVTGFPSGPFDFQPTPQSYQIPPSGVMAMLPMTKSEMASQQFHHYRDNSFPMETNHHFPRPQSFPPMISYQCMSVD
jgi:hypothetical protein